MIGISKQLKQIISGYFLWVWYYLSKKYRNKRKEEAKRRIKICESCEYFLQSARMCDLCGCLMDVKTKMEFPLDEEGKSIDGCWDRKW
jgi:hypothetical protein